MIQIDDKKSCMGCTTCASICSKNELFYDYHIYVENVEDLKKFGNSKYVQSDMGDCFK